MDATFAEIKRFQVKPDRTQAFEALIRQVAREQEAQPGCLCVKYMKRFYTIDGVEPGSPPRELTRVVKCVKYLSYWEFDCKESYGKAIQWFFDSHGKAIMRLLIVPFDIDCGDSLQP